VNPHAPAVQVRVRQSLSVPGHSEAVVHCGAHWFPEHTLLQHCAFVVQNPPPGTQGGWHWLPEQRLLQQSPFALQNPLVGTQQAFWQTEPRQLVLQH